VPTQRRTAGLDPTITHAIDGVLEHRAAIEQAKGVLIHAFGIDEDEAFERLRTASSTSNTKLHELAEARLVLCVKEPAPDDVRRHVEGLLRGASEVSPGPPTG
jgi:hypothetical protein